MADFDPYYYTNVTFLMHMDGINDTAPSVDMKGHTITSAGNVLLKTAVFKYGSASAYFPGAAGDVLTVPDSADFEFGSGDFTVEMWVRPTSAVDMEFISKDAGAPGYTSFGLMMLANQSLRIMGTTTNTSHELMATSAAAAIPLNTWTHIALVRSADTFVGYVGGVAVCSQVLSGTLYDNAGTLIIGARGGSFNPTVGYIDDTRITKGLARYTDTFTPSATAFLHGGAEELIAEAPAGADTAASQSVSSRELTSSAAAATAETISTDVDKAQAEAVTCTATFADATLTFYLEAIGLSDSISVQANTTLTFLDSAALADVIQQAINQIVSDSAAGADSLNPGAALTLVDVADAVATQTSTYNSVMLVAELIATLEAYNSVGSEDITEAGMLTDAFAARVQAIAAVLEAAQVVDPNTVLVHVMQSASDTADAATDITSAGSLLNALLNDAVLATIRLNIGGELFTGWVLNADSLAPSEYQFADLQFNSACKHGDTYLLAADDGIYQFTEETGVETVMTYIKTGKTDFGSDLKKRVVNSYMVYSASGQMVLKVTTSEFGNLVTRNYRMTPQAADTTDTRRIDIGKGIKSRYWQFEVVGEGVDCDIDEIGMLPIVLSRRI